MKKLLISIENDIAFELTAANEERTVDDLGRVLIPSKVARQLAIKPGDTVSVYYNEETRIVVLRTIPHSQPHID